MRRKIKKNEYALCLPLTGKNSQVLEDQINEEGIKAYDFFEWRRDYFEDASQKEDEVLKKIRRLIKEKGLIYTFRNNREGGVSTLPDQVRLETIKKAINTGLIDYIDVELYNSAYFLEEINQAIVDSGVKKILSYHDFNQTPPDESIIKLLDEMVLNEADVLKLALHVTTKNDLRRLIKIALDYSQGIDQAIVLVGMGQLGRITRIAPDLCGGSLSFAAGKRQTAPGQLSSKEITKQRKILALM